MFSERLTGSFLGLSVLSKAFSLPSAPLLPLFVGPTLVGQRLEIRNGKGPKGHCPEKPLVAFHRLSQLKSPSTMLSRGPEPGWLCRWPAFTERESTGPPDVRQGDVGFHTRTLCTMERSERSKVKESWKCQGKWQQKKSEHYKSQGPRKNQGWGLLLRELHHTVNSCGSKSSSPLEGALPVLPFLCLGSDNSLFPTTTTRSPLSVLASQNERAWSLYGSLLLHQHSDFFFFTLITYFLTLILVLIHFS